MTLRGKLVLAQAPLAIALALVGVLSASVTARLAGQSRLILADNYRSVLAAQRMKESLERIDSNAVYRVVGHDAGTDAAIETHRRTFENELQVQEGNITETGEADATRALRASWNAYVQALDAFMRDESRAARERGYFEKLQPTFFEIKQRADEILAMNQDAMVRKSDLVADRAHLLEQVVTASVVLAALLGVLAATWLMARVLRPLRVVSAAVRRFGEGDLKARADVRGKD